MLMKDQWNLVSHVRPRSHCQFADRASLCTLVPRIRTLTLPRPADPFSHPAVISPPPPFRRHGPDSRQSCGPFADFTPPTADACVRTKLDLTHPCGLSLIHLTLFALFLESPAKPRYPGYARTSLQSLLARSPTHTMQTPWMHTIEDTLRHVLMCHGSVRDAFPQGRSGVARPSET